jgi:hypothetical protein
MEDLRRVQVRLSKPEQQQLDKLLRGGRQPVLKRKLMPRVGRETVRILLESHELKPWREKMWCVAELDEEYIARVEDVLAVYQKPLSVREPMVGIDERPVVLHEEVGPPVAMQPGRVARRDAEPALRNGQRFLRRPTQSGAAFHQGDATDLTIFLSPRAF